MKWQGKRDEAIRALQEAVAKSKDSEQLAIRVELSRMHATPATIPSPNVVRLTTPQPKEQRGSVELLEAPALAQVDKGQSRLMQQRPTLPPLPDIDLTAGSVREWECSAKTKSKN